MKQYYFLNARNEQCGPVDESELIKYDVTYETYVWTTGMSGWQKAGEIVSHQFLTGNNVPPPPPGVTVNTPPKFRASTTTVTSSCPETYMVWSILATVLCCLPAGVVSVIYSSKVDSLWRNGQYNEARDASNKAKLWCIISAGVGIIVWFIWVLCVLISGL
ncbi:MAG: CD225/dispanin family protein [Muribaculaceae bacterium]|nr:CD225/dispanin family protein [Muribaculaceae bacterium]MDE7387241.1 CD225/dispanin family protein [Muribaculaceae bacterium]